MFSLEFAHNLNEIVSAFQKNNHKLADINFITHKNNNSDIILGSDYAHIIKERDIILNNDCIYSVSPQGIILKGRSRAYLKNLHKIPKFNASRRANNKQIPSYTNIATLKTLSNQNEALNPNLTI